MRFRPSTFVLVGVLFLACFVVPATGAAAATTFDVEMGHVLHVKGAPAESMRFFPSTIDVHQGDTLTFTSASVHTATFVPAGQDAVDWFGANAVLGSSEPLALVRPNPDNGPNAFKFTNGAYYATDPSCGGTAQPACSFDGTSSLNSGLLAQGAGDFSVTTNASAGTSFWVVCLIHGPAMRLRVNVVPAAQPASDPAALAAAKAADIAQDTNTARALVERFRGRHTSQPGPHDTRVWNAWAGVDGAHVSVYAMFPHRLIVAKGDTVRWHFDSLNFEDHTVSFPFAAASKVANTFDMVCDPDGDAGPRPDQPPDLPDYPYCNVASQLELQLGNGFVLPSGNSVFRGPGSPLHSSGVRGANSVVGDASYSLTFATRSPATGFRYLCMIHTDMRGRVVVR